MKFNVTLSHFPDNGDWCLSLVDKTDSYYADLYVKEEEARALIKLLNLKKTIGHGCEYWRLPGKLKKRIGFEKIVFSKN